MQINFKKIVGFFLALVFFGVHYFWNNVVCRLAKERKCEKDIPHIFESVRIDQKNFMPSFVASVSGTLSIITSDVGRGHWE